jgi:addiction module RelB/DinJ family antitoxin
MERSATFLAMCIAIVRTYAYNKTIKERSVMNMATKSANLYARIEPEVKEQAERILATLGIPASNAINMFYKQIILNRGLPFEVKIPTSSPVDISKMSAEALDMELEKGYADMLEGRTKPAAQVFSDIRKDYNG